MELQFETIAEEDVPALTVVMKRAFDDDARTHLGVESGGPPGYDNGDFFRRWLFGHDETDGYKIVHEGRVVGGIIVWILEHGDNILGTVFVDPGLQDRGVGLQTWQFIERTYPNTRSWKLGTPKWAVKNHYFYETKCGFFRAGENEEEVRYEKVMLRPA